MRIIIDALSQVGAGSRTYLYNMLPRLTAAEGELNFTVLWPERVSLPPGVSSGRNLVFRFAPVPLKPALIRVLHQQLVIPFLTRKADLFFAPVDTAPLACPVPVVLAVRNPNPFYDLDRSPGREVYFGIKKFLIQLSARRSARVIFVSEHSRDHIGKQLGVPRERSRVIYHGIDQARFHPGGEGRGGTRDWEQVRDGGSILGVSTITPHKNMETLIQAYALLPAPLTRKHRLKIAGRIASPAYFQVLKDLAASEGIGERVDFLGEFPYAEIHQLYQQAAVFVLPSRLETFGHTLVEAMVSGVPVIASSRSAVPEILGGAGVLFDPDSPAELKAHLQHVLTAGDLARDLTRRSLERGESFSWERTTEKLLGVFQEFEG